MTHTSFTEVLWKNPILEVEVESQDVHFWRNIREIVGVYGKSEGNQSRSWQDHGNYGDEASKDWEGDLRIFREDTIHKQIHNPAYHDTWATFPTT